MSQPSRQIAVLIPPVTGFGRGLLRGVIQYARHVGCWRFLGDAANPPLGYHLPAESEIDGIIGQLHQSEVRAAVQDLTVPIVNTSAAPLPFPTVASDYECAGRLAADHLLDRGFKNFAFWGTRWIPERCYNGYAMRLREAGYTADVRLFDDQSWEQQLSHMTEWIARLPRPVGVLTRNDAMGLKVLRACDRHGLRVPEDVAIVGVTNDELLCEMCTPPLSSVALSVERQGYVAAELLDRLMAGEPAPSRPVFIEPQGVITRQSTDVLLVDDPETAHAVSFIRQHATDPIRVEDVLREMAISRRSLESRFKRLLGRGPASEIRHVQLERARQLLTTSDLSIAAIAVEAGFSSPEYMARVFQRSLGISPREYRMHGRAS